MMPGMVMLWHGAVVDIPSGWHLCDGTVGTPDLRNKFVVAAGGSYNPGAEGGDVDHNHTLLETIHVHGIQSQDTVGLGAFPFQLTAQVTDPAASSGYTSTDSHLPPYYALCYIMKL